MLARRETSPEDIEGIITERGGMILHAVVVASGIGKCSVVGCSKINFLGTNECTTSIEIAGKVYKEGDL